MKLVKSIVHSIFYDSCRICISIENFLGIDLAKLTHFFSSHHFSTPLETSENLTVF